MPRKRRERSADTTTPAQLAARAAMQEVVERSERTRLAQPGMTPEKRAQQREATRQRTGKRLAKAYASWDAATPEWRAAQGAEILDGQRRYDRSAKLPADGGRGLYAIRELARQGNREVERERDDRPSSLPAATKVGRS